MMKTLRRRAIAKAAGMKYFKRADGCYCVSRGKEFIIPYYPRMSEETFLRIIKRTISF